MPYHILNMLVCTIKHPMVEHQRMLSKFICLIADNHTLILQMIIEYIFQPLDFKIGINRVVFHLFLTKAQGGTGCIRYSFLLFKLTNPYTVVQKGWFLFL